QGEQYTEVAKALREGELDRAPVTPAERLLLELVGTLTRHAYRITDDQVQGLRDVGWSDAQIAEAVYDGALFNMLVRIADAFDIQRGGGEGAGGVRAVIIGDGEHRIGRSQGDEEPGRLRCTASSEGTAGAVRRPAGG